MSQEQVNKKTLVNKKNGYVIHLWGRPQDVGPYEINLSMTNKPTEIIGYATSIEGLNSSIHNMVYVYVNQGYELVEYNLRPEVLTLLREQYPEYATVLSPSGEVGVIITITDYGSLRVQGPNDIYTLPFGTYGAFEVVT